MSSTIKVTFYQVQNNAAKIKLIGAKAQEAFHQEKRLLIKVSNLEAAQYIDSLLWQIPEESFMPHKIDDTATSEWIAITTQHTLNINQAPRLLNLCPQPISMYEGIEEIYEFYDITHPQKLELSQHRIKHYQSKGFMVNEATIFESAKS